MIILRNFQNQIVLNYKLLVANLGAVDHRANYIVQGSATWRWRLGRRWSATFVISKNNETTEPLPNTENRRLPFSYNFLIKRRCFQFTLDTSSIKSTKKSPNHKRIPQKNLQFHKVISKEISNHKRSLQPLRNHEPKIYFCIHLIDHTFYGRFPTS